MHSQKIRIVIADDHPVTLEGIKRSIDNDYIEIISTACNSTEMLRLLDQGGVDVLLTDYSMPGGEHGDGLPLLGLIFRRYPQLSIVVMTMLDNSGLLRTIVGTGVRCLVSKMDHADHLTPAIRAASIGRKYFSPTMQSILMKVNERTLSEIKQVSLSNREMEVLRLLFSGMKINDIAARLHRSKQTISSQKGSAMRKIGVDNDADLFKYVLEVGLATFP
jgi:two-component system, NarL family, captular synthesis response regulator RcsB